MRWITTYGREGMWLTDISPYIFMLQEDEERRFRYKGANKGDLTIQLIFSRQGGNESTSPTSATFAFTGGQFDGSYNNESRYVDLLNFSVPQNTSKVEIVATITGHGFQKMMQTAQNFATMSIITTSEITTCANGILSWVLPQDVKVKLTMA